MFQTKYKLGYRHTFRTTIKDADPAQNNCHLTFCFGRTEVPDMLFATSELDDRFLPPAGRCSETTDSNESVPALSPVSTILPSFGRSSVGQTVVLVVENALPQDDVRLVPCLVPFFTRPWVHYRSAIFFLSLRTSFAGRNSGLSHCGFENHHPDGSDLGPNSWFPFPLPSILATAGHRCYTFQPVYMDHNNPKQRQQI
ncbi:uncharacterized protein LOC108102123 [Drosophila ficusphila]|uniref:uncharacterized protein LOC108102123 n=1 Tax=Drosophila ficusphila TaxID=30025 RepID=UPI0007E7417A|nr:uncharacterized protein LOC108102123 [Drosophila ficusphila]